MGFMSTYRVVIFVLCIILSIPVIGLAADITHLTSEVNVTTLSFETLSLLIAAVSLLVFPLLLVVSHFRKNAFLVYILYELGIVCLLWILWVVAASLTIQKKDALLRRFDSCSVFANSVAVQKCNEVVAIEGIEVVIFVLLLKYMLVLFVYAVVVHLRTGNGQVWFQDVSELEGTISLPALTHKSSDMESAGEFSVPMGTYSNATSMPQLQMAPATYGGAPAQTATY